MATQSSFNEFEPLISPTFSNKKKVWYKTASAYWLFPSLSLITMTGGLGITTRVQFYLRAVCYDYHSSKGQSLSSSFILNPINDYPDEWCNNADVQAITSRFLMILTLCSAIPGTFVLAPLGLLSDIKGRKICLLLAIMGLFSSTLNILLVGNYLDTFGLYFLLVGGLLEGFSGGYLSLIASSYAYATDCTPTTQRSMIFGLLHGTLFMGFVGPMIGGWIVDTTNDLLSVFYIMSVIYIITFLFFLFILPESLTEEKLLENLNRQQESGSTESYRNKSLKSWLIDGILKPLMIFIVNNNDDNNEKNKKRSLLFLAIINTLISAAIMGIQSVFLLYITLVFKWSLVEQGYSLFVIGASRLIVMLVLFPILISKIKRHIHLKNLRNNNWFNNSNNNDDEPIFVENINNEEGQLRKFEVWILRSALLIDIISYVGYGLATSSSMFVIATIISSFGTVANSITKSLQTSLVSPSQVGQLLGALSVLESITRVVSPTAFNALYSILVVTSPNLIWYGIALILAVACLFSFSRSFSHLHN